MNLYTLKTTKFSTLGIIILLLVSSNISITNAQNQDIRGRIVDQMANYPIAGAIIEIKDSDPIIGTYTDEDGYFKLEEVKVGRYVLIVESLGYKTLSLPNILVKGGKQTVLNIKLDAAIGELNEVVITDKSIKDRPQNEMSTVSSRSFNLEQTNRFSGGSNDISKLVTSFAGVSAPNDSRNDIVVRGNSPVGLLWLVEGLPIGNTNHFATLGTTGGPVSAINTNALSTSNFLTSSFPAEYGNSTAAIFDLGLRPGNQEEHEFTFQWATFSGIEAMAEGPIKREKRSSYLLSVRNGLVLAGAGTTATPRYRDLSFKINLPKTAIGSISIFGISGLSNIDFIGEKVQADDLFSNPGEDIFVNNSLGLLGVKNEFRFSKNTYLTTSLGMSINRAYMDQYNFKSYIINNSGQSEAIDTPRYHAVEVKNDDDRYTLRTTLNSKMSNRMAIRGGILIELYNMNFNSKDRDNRNNIPDSNNDNIPDYFFTSINIKEKPLLIQEYFQFSYKMSNFITLNAGVHSQQFTYNNSNAIEPRMGLSWSINSKQSLSFGYGLHSQIVPLPIFFREERVTNSVGSIQSRKTNTDLGFMKANHFVAGYDYRFLSDWRLKFETYYQYLFNIPIERGNTSTYSLLNDGSSFAFEQKNNLVSEGVGSNYGIEITLEKFFSNNYYGLLTTSLFSSNYVGADGKERQTTYNNRWVINILAGKEYPINGGQSVFSIDTKIGASGGRPYSRILLDASRENANREVLDTNSPNSEQLKAYLRWDLKIGYRWNRPKSSHTWYIDFLNVLNRKNEYRERFNEVTGNIVTVVQRGFFVDFMYKFEF